MEFLGIQMIVFFLPGRGITRDNSVISQMYIYEGCPFSKATSAGIRCQATEPFEQEPCHPHFLVRKWSLTAPTSVCHRGVLEEQCQPQSKLFPPSWGCASNSSSPCLLPSFQRASPMALFCVRSFFLHCILGPQLLGNFRGQPKAVSAEDVSWLWGCTSKESSFKDHFLRPPLLPQIRDCKLKYLQRSRNWGKWKKTTGKAKMWWTAEFIFQGKEKPTRPLGSSFRTLQLFNGSQRPDFMCSLPILKHQNTMLTDRTQRSMDSAPGLISQPWSAQLTLCWLNRTQQNIEQSQWTLPPGSSVSHLCNCVSHQHYCSLLALLGLRHWFTFSPKWKCWVQQTEKPICTSWNNKEFHGHPQGNSH